MKNENEYKLANLHADTFSSHKYPSWPQWNSQHKVSTAASTHHLPISHHYSSSHRRLHSYHHHSTTIWQHTNTLFTWLVSQPAINIFLSYQINTSHQQYFSFITNQHQPLTTAKRTEWITSSPGQGQETGPIWWQHISIHLVVRHGSSGQPHHDLAMGPFGVYTGIQKPT